MLSKEITLLKLFWRENVRNLHAKLKCGKKRCEIDLIMQIPIAGRIVDGSEESY
jgi:hypothetical protein